MWFVRSAAVPLLVSLATGCTSESLNDDPTQCIDLNDGRYAETFDASEIEALVDQCWRSDNEGAKASSVGNKIFLEDGDLVMRVAADSGGSDVDDWTDADQAPMFYRRVEGDFIAVVRTEAASMTSGDHCIAPGNRAGLVVRDAADTALWATLTIEPYLFTASGEPANCAEDSDDTNDATASVELAGSTASFGSAEAAGIGVDGEADIALCRVGSEVRYFYGVPTSDPTKNTWLPMGNELWHAFGDRGLDVGITVAGKAPNFEVAGHFNWIVFDTGAYGDGCAGALELFQLPDDL